VEVLVERERLRRSQALQPADMLLPTAPLEELPIGTDAGGHAGSIRVRRRLRSVARGTVAGAGPTQETPGVRPPFQLWRMATWFARSWERGSGQRWRLMFPWTWRPGGPTIDPCLPVDIECPASWAVDRRSSPAHGWSRLNWEGRAMGGFSKASKLLAVAGLISMASIAFPQGEWRERTPTNRPPARGGPGAAYDSLRGVIVMFGGCMPNGCPSSYADTWEWDGTDWTQRFPPTSPPLRSSHGMAYDSLRRKTVLYGGSNRNSGVLGDTWEWDGSNWTQRLSANSPPRRAYPGLAYDQARGVTVLFGGNDPASGLYGDTWEWNGIDWVRRNPATSPPPRTVNGLAYDVGRRRVLLHGPFADTWEWDGTNWTQRTPATSPPQRGGHGLAYDSTRNRTVLFGGENAGGEVGDTWEWDGNNWFQQALSGPLPPPRGSVAMAFHGRTNKTILFGGHKPTLPQREYDDTWEYASCIQSPPPCSQPCCSVGAGHCAGGLVLSCTTAPSIGTTFCLSFTNPGPSARYNLLLVGQRLDPAIVLNPPGLCSIAFLYSYPIVILEAAGNPVTFCVALPSESVLVGQRLLLQGGSFEIPGCFTLTDGVLVTIQR